MDVTLRIKNLSIALEALSNRHKIGISDPYHLEAGVELCLKTELDKLEEEQITQKTLKPTTDDDDDIPF